MVHCVDQLGLNFDVLCIEGNLQSTELEWTICNCITFTVEVERHCIQNAQLRLSENGKN